jgi:hypothetical protein
MSYADMDHAAWVERNNSAGRRNTKKPKTDKHGRAVGYHIAPETLTPFQAKVMDILGMMFGGIYNAPITWETVDWDFGRGGLSLVVSSSGGLATFDFNRLTMFVLLCHVARIRGDMSNAGPSNIRLSFWQRGSTGGISERHPNIAEAVATFEQYLPADHRVRWVEPVGSISTEAA